ncbi:MAG: prenyltransferase [Candidatus Accumulibacter sp.]|jgi:1,4-dihydroxy-2-naphthoate octaprenyltransferase|nr:prenyltransferase [Accumulibacter sp.]
MFAESAKSAAKPAAEPTLETLPNPVVRYFAATRPAFLSVTLVSCLIGLSTARFGGFPLQIDKALATIFFALLAHGGINVINDYYDAQNGSDAANRERIFPFTGGSRFIQNGVLSQRRMGIFGYAQIFVVMLAGLWLMRVSGPELLWIGLVGLFVGWAYSAPPLQLMCRGWGEPAIVAGWTLIAAGADFVQRGQVALLPWLAGLPFALLVANILYINQFPDRQADASAGKRTLVVRLGPESASWGCLLIALCSYAAILLLVARNILPIYAAAGAFALPFSFTAARELIAHANTPALLPGAIKRTIIAANASGLLLALGLALAAPSL